MTPDPATGTVPPDDYGVDAVRRRYPRFLLTGLFIAALLHGALLGLYWAADSLAAEAVQNEVPVLVNYADAAPPSISDPPSDVPPPPAPAAAPPTAGVVTPVPDDEADPEATFADQVELDESSIGVPGGTGLAGGVPGGTGTTPAPPPPSPPPPSEPPPPPPPPPSEPPPPEVFDVVEQNPVLIGGLEALQRSVEYPDIARRAGIEGTVFLQFVVTETGAVDAITVARSPSDALSQAAIRALRTVRFEPGQQRGVPVRVRYTLPVRFSLR